MKHHLVTGLVILTVLLGLGLWTTDYLSKQAKQAEEELEAAFQLAAQGELELAHEHTEKAAKRWENTSRLAACLSHHQKLELIEGLFQELRAWYQVKDVQEYAVVCRRLSAQLSALADGEKPLFYNLL